MMWESHSNTFLLLWSEHYHLSDTAWVCAHVFTVLVEAVAVNLTVRCVPSANSIDCSAAAVNLSPSFNWAKQNESWRHEAQWTSISMSVFDTASYEHHVLCRDSNINMSHAKVNNTELQNSAMGITTAELENKNANSARRKQWWVFFFC